MKYTPNNTLWSAEGSESQTKMHELYLIGSHDLNNAIFKDSGRNKIYKIYSQPISNTSAVHEI